MVFTGSVVDVNSLRVSPKKSINGHSVQRVTIKTLDGSTIVLNCYRPERQAKRK